MKTRAYEYEIEDADLDQRWASPILVFAGRVRFDSVDRSYVVEVEYASPGEYERIQRRARVTLEAVVEDERLLDNLFGRLNKEITDHARGAPAAPDDIE